MSVHLGGLITDTTPTSRRLPPSQMPHCDRCGQPAEAPRIDVSTYGDPGRWVWGPIVCKTPGCVDESGSSVVDPPDEPGQLTRADRQWIRRQQRLAVEFGEVCRKLGEVT